MIPAFSDKGPVSNPMLQRQVADPSRFTRLCHAAYDTAKQGGFVTDVLVIVLAWALVNLRYLSGDSFIPWDNVDAFFPQAHFVASAIRGGQAPWWNPYIFAGQPVLGDPQGMIFTPQVVVGLIAGSHFNLFVFDTTSLVMQLCGGIALARYARTYSDSRVLPILGALVFLAGGVATSRLQHTTQIDSYSLVPIQLLCLRAVCQRPTWLRTGLLAAVLTAGVLNPNQVVFLSFFALMPFLGLHLYQSPQRAKAILALVVAGLVVALAALPMISAMVEFAALSNRTSITLDASGAGSTPILDLPSVFLQGLCGVLSVPNGIWPTTEISQDFWYIGIIPAGIVLLSAFYRSGLAAPRVLCWASLLLWFVFATGVNTPVYPFLFNHLPGLSAFRRPADAGYLLNLFLALLIGTCRKPDLRRFGSGLVAPLLAGALLVALGGALALLALYAQRVGHEPDLLPTLRGSALRLSIVLAVGLALLSLGRRATHYLAAPALIGLTIIDLDYGGRAGDLFAPAARPAAFAAVYSGTLSWKKPLNPLEASITFLQHSDAAGNLPAYRMEALGGSLGSSMPMVFRILTTQGYNPMVLRSYDQAIGAQNLQNDAKHFTAESPNYDSADYRRLGLRYVLIERYIATNAEYFGVVGATIANIRTTFFTNGSAVKLQDDGEYEVWQLPNPLPRAMVQVADAEHACDIVSYKTTRVSIRCHAEAPGRLVLGDAFAPGWQACVNGDAVPVAPYRSIFRSVIVPEGDSRVIFYYQPVPFLRGSSCSA